MLTGDRHLSLNDLRLEGGGELLCLRETEPEVGQAGLLIALDVCDLDLRRLPASDSVTSLTRHTCFGTGSPSFHEPKSYRSRNKPRRLACSPSEFSFYLLHPRGRPHMHQRRDKAKIIHSCVLYTEHFLHMVVCE
jgi:hypothetical protein